jgi:RNA polymerase-binding transcription factor DksA
MTLDPTAVRVRLQARAAELTARDAALTKHLRQQDGRLEQDFSDRVAYVEMDEVLERLDEAARAELKRIDAALVRLDAGTYDTCVRCGDPIPAARLAAVPTTPLCTSCATALET